MSVHLIGDMAHFVFPEGSSPPSDWPKGGCLRRARAPWFDKNAPYGFSDDRVSVMVHKDPKGWRLEIKGEVTLLFEKEPVFTVPLP